MSDTKPERKPRKTTRKSTASKPAPAKEPTAVEQPASEPSPTEPTAPATTTPPRARPVKREPAVEPDAPAPAAEPVVPEPAPAEPASPVTTEPPVPEPAAPMPGGDAAQPEPFAAEPAPSVPTEPPVPEPAIAEPPLPEVALAEPAPPITAEPAIVEPVRAEPGAEAPQPEPFAAEPTLSVTGEPPVPEPAIAELGVEPSQPEPFAAEPGVAVPAASPVVELSPAEPASPAGLSAEPVATTTQMAEPTIAPTVAPERVVVTGATGLVGKKLCAQLMQEGYEVIVFSRKPETAREAVPNTAGYVEWTPTSAGNWAHALEGVYGVIHLAGAPIFGQRWDTAYKQELRDSRVVSTRLLVEAMAGLQHKPAVFVSGSAVGYYGHRDDTRLDEQAAPGDDFLAQVCAEWEQEARKAEALGIRTVTVRTGIVLDAHEGALAQMKIPFQFFAGGPILPGTQWFSWIHVDDEVGIIMLALEDERVRGPLNATAPEPQTNKDFTATLGKVLGAPAWLPVPGFSLKLLLGELANNLVEGQRVIPQKALDMGYQFQYPTSEQALRNLLKR